MKLKFTLVANDDLEKIWEYIAVENPQVATHVVQMLVKKCEILAENPLLERQRDELAPGLRSFPSKNYMIFYRVSAKNVEIVRILSAAQDISSLF